MARILKSLDNPPSKWALIPQRDPIFGRLKERPWFWASKPTSNSSLESYCGAEDSVWHTNKTEGIPGRVSWSAILPTRWKTRFQAVVLEIALDLVRPRNSFKAPNFHIFCPTSKESFFLRSISPKLLSQQSLVESEQAPNPPTSKTTGSRNLLPIKNMELE